MRGRRGRSGWSRARATSSRCPARLQPAGTARRSPFRTSAADSRLIGRPPVDGGEGQAGRPPARIPGPALSCNRSHVEPLAGRWSRRGSPAPVTRSCGPENAPTLGRFRRHREARRSRMSRRRRLLPRYVPVRAFRGPTTSITARNEPPEGAPAPGLPSGRRYLRWTPAEIVRNTAGSVSSRPAAPINENVLRSGSRW